MKKAFIKIFMILAILCGGTYTICSADVCNLSSDYESNGKFVYKTILLMWNEKASDENYVKEILNLVNKERRQRGIAPLHLSIELTEAARIRAEEISRVFSHTRPNGKSCHSMFRNGQYTIGENIAAGNPTAEATVRQWMNSKGHRANILNPDYTEIGVGFHYKPNSEYKYYWVEIFKRPLSRAYR